MRTLDIEATLPMAMNDVTDRAIYKSDNDSTAFINDTI